jgi:hypothetical protein
MAVPETKECCAVSVAVTEVPGDLGRKFN